MHERDTRKNPANDAQLNVGITLEAGGKMDGRRAGAAPANRNNGKDGRRMNRRFFLRILAVGLLIAALPTPCLAGNASPAIPILMFHKVDDRPEDPESISPRQLEALFTRMWNLGFYPVNMSDILKNRVDSVVPGGLKPVGITVDDAHPSVLFSRLSTPASGELRNSRSFVEVLRDSLEPFGRAPRATIFIGRVGDDRISTIPGEYFGGYLPLPDALALLDETPGVEAGYHTIAHKSMTAMGAAETRATLEAQREEFATEGVLERVVPILAYPYGHPPLPEGLEELRAMGFWGAALAFPGVREGRHDTSPVCEYDGTLLTDPFLVPRVNIGAYAYPYRPADRNEPFVSLDPWADFQKDVLNAMPSMYVAPK